jgi:hypothetical protein
MFPYIEQFWLIFLEIFCIVYIIVPIEIIIMAFIVNKISIVTGELIDVYVYD